MAKKRLDEKELTLSIVRNGDILFESDSHGISGFLRAIGKLEGKLEGASVADRIAGKAIALLCAYARVKALYALTLSERGKAVLQKYVVYHEYDNLVESVLSIDRVELCPFEKLAVEISDPVEAYERLKALQSSLTQQ